MEHIDYTKEAEFRTRYINHTGGAAAEAVTVRDYFAVRAMQALIGNARLAIKTTDSMLAEASYQIADAMMTERSK